MSSETGRPLLRLGTSSWSCKDWKGRFYPPEARPAEFIRYYAERLDTVEIDSTFYGTPGAGTVARWRDQTPETFVFAAKAPRMITHDKCLEHCAADFAVFVETLSVLGPRLGPILLQFPYFAAKTGMTCEVFCEKLSRFLNEVSREHAHLAVEIRNKHWLQPRLFDLLGAHDVALAIIDHPWMPRPPALMMLEGALTGPFVYIRWLGDRHGIEKRTKTWSETIIDREPDLAQCVSPIQRLLAQHMPVFGYFNNHYAGYAPDNVGLMQRLVCG